MTSGLVLSLRLLSAFALHCICASASCFLFVDPQKSVSFLLFCSLDVCGPVLLKLTVKTCNVSICCMPNNAWLIPETTKYLHNSHLLLQLVVILQMPKSGIVVLLYVLKMLFLFLLLPTSLLLPQGLKYKKYGMALYCNHIIITSNSLFSLRLPNFVWYNCAILSTAGVKVCCYY